MVSIVYVARYTRLELRANPHNLYVFGDNKMRVGFGGQAKECRGEPNSHGIATLIAPGVFFTDDTYVDNAMLIKRDIDLLAYRLSARKGAAIVFPLDGIGTGLARLAETAPMTRGFLDAQLLEVLGIVNNIGQTVSRKMETAHGPAEDKTKLV